MCTDGAPLKELSILVAISGDLGHATPDNRAFKAAVLPAVQKYAQIGIRVEDSFLLTDTGLTSLSSTVPRTIEDVEAFMKNRAK